MDLRTAFLCLAAVTMVTAASLPCTPYTDVEMHDLCRKCPPLNKLMYFPDPCDSCNFMQCYMTGYGRWSMQNMPCPKCQCMNFDKLTCEPSEHHDDEDCDPPPNVTEGVDVDGGRCTVYGPNGIYQQTFGVVAGEPEKYYWYVGGTTYEMSCAPGTIFNLTLCRCVHDPDYNAKREPIMCLNFNDDDDPFNTHTGVSVSPVDVDILPIGIVGNCAYFNGKSSWIEVPFFNNWEGETLSISIWVRRIAPASGTVPDFQAVVSNKDCEAGGPDASIQIRSDYSAAGDTTIGGGFRTTSGDNLDAFDNNVANGWTHVVLKYNGAKISMYIDGVQVIPDVDATGPIIRIKCPLLIGAEYLDHYFHGCLDEMCFYDYDLNDNQISHLFNNPADIFYPPA